MNDNTCTPYKNRYVTLKGEPFPIGKLGLILQTRGVLDFKYETDDTVYYEVNPNHSEEKVLSLISSLAADLTNI